MQTLFFPASFYAQPDPIMIWFSVTFNSIQHISMQEKLDTGQTLNSIVTAL